MLIGNRFQFHEVTTSSGKKKFCYTGSPEAALLSGGEISQIYLWGRPLTKLEHELVYAKQFIRVSSHLLIFWWSEIAKILPSDTMYSESSSLPWSSGIFDAKSYFFPGQSNKQQFDTHSYLILLIKDSVHGISGIINAKSYFFLIKLITILVPPMCLILLTITKTHCLTFKEKHSKSK